MAVTNQDVQKLYIAYFNRPADYFGLQFQVKAANATSLAAVANGFANSPEFLNEYAGKTDAQFVNALYVNLFGRQADLPGLSFWINLLNTGVVTKGTIAIELLKGAINQDAVTIASKVAAADAFYAAVDTTAEATSYSGAAANAVAKAFLAGITTPETLAAAIAPAALDATLAAVVVAGSPAPVDTTFNTTAGVDTFLGTVGSDVVNVGGDVTTLNAGDTLAGGNGIDTLNITVAPGVNSSLAGSISGFENVNISGADNFGISAANAAKAAAVTTATAAKTATAAQLVAATNVVVTADANVVTAEQVKAAAIAIGTLTTETAIVAATTATATPGDTTDYTVAQYKAAALAATKSAANVTLVTSGNDDVAMTARADALVITATNAKIGAEAVAAAALEQINVAATADAVAAANLSAATAALGTLPTPSFSASAFAGATNITMDGTGVTVTGLNAQKLTLTGGAVNDILTYSTTATAANIALSGTSGTLTLKDGATVAVTNGPLATLNLSGSSKATAATTHTLAGAGAVTVVDSLNMSSSITTANLAITNATNVNTSSMGKLTKIDASASTGAITLTSNGALVSNITTGAGADIVTISTVTSLTDLTKPAAVTVSTGAGNDIITISTSGTGTTSIMAGDGNDTIALTGALNTSVTVDGGAGNDSLSVLNTGTFGLSDYLLIAAQVTNVEGMKFAGAGSVSVNASSMSQFNGFTFIGGGLNATNTITKVLDAQTLSVIDTDLNATAKSYVDSDDVGTGTLTINAAGGTSLANATAVNVTAQASAVVLNVALAASTTEMAAVDSNIILSGDVTAATVNLTSAANYAKAPTGDVFGNVLIQATNSNLVQLDTVTLTGNGHVTIDNSTGSITTINAAALTSALKTGVLAGTASGNSLTLTTSAAVAETITLGTGVGHDVINDSTSTFAKMDTITNFKLTADGIGGVVAGGDVLNVSVGGAAFVAAGAGTATALAGSTFGAVLTNAGLLSAANVVFQFGGDTYVYADTGAAGLDAGDIVIKLTGLIDSTLLASTIINNVG